MACGLPFLTSPVGQAASWQAEGVFTENIVASQNPQDWINACELILAKSLPEKQRDAQIIRSYIVEHHELSKWMMQFIKLLE
jgi:hypothetical protein